jgi:C4-dicarboxylate-specific signal transduction histidine kinase
MTDGHRAGDVIARIRALFNKEPPQARLLNLNVTINHAVELTRAETSKRRTVVRLELAKAPIWVNADAVQLQQVLVNLMTNALEAMSGITGRRRLMTIRSEITATGEARTTVEDTGCGLSEAAISQMFDGFYTTKPNGFGLGLAISRSVIEAHGGSLWAAAAPLHGARIGFDLPLALAEDGALKQRGSAKAKS